ncbi:hypothetical protein [Lactococcus formosensis]|uniref:hypothetical protein n=1 Tax=Lactococcus formosensis TaxID=1281486 RepID=UPI00254F6D45|nr:hypothetical protein [Lactococcus formosensis]
MKSKAQPDIFACTHGTQDIETDDWRIVRSVLRTMLRQSKNARTSKEALHSLDQITNPDHRRIFKKYFMNGQGIVKISIDEHYDESVVRSYISSATKEFAAVYCNGALTKAFIKE